MNNYIRLSSLSLFRRHFAFVDTSNFLADRLFINEKISVKFENSYISPDSDYVVVFCSVRKNKEDKFVEVMEKLYNKMLLLGRSDYPDFCDKLMEIFANGRK